jgi:hypothetical protein
MKFLSHYRTRMPSCRNSLGTACHSPNYGTILAGTCSSPDFLPWRARLVASVVKAVSRTQCHGPSVTDPVSRTQCHGPTVDLAGGFWWRRLVLPVLTSVWGRWGISLKNFLNTCSRCNAFSVQRFLSATLSQCNTRFTRRMVGLTAVAIDPYFTS